jgi:hypothetical protein
MIRWDNRKRYKIRAAKRYMAVFGENAELKNVQDEIFLLLVIMLQLTTG